MTIILYDLTSGRVKTRLNKNNTFEAPVSHFQFSSSVTFHSESDEFVFLSSCKYTLGSGAFALTQQMMAKLRKPIWYIFEASIKQKKTRRNKNHSQKWRQIDRNERINFCPF